MNLNKQLAKAIEIATVAHKDQYDKSGNPYILHPLHLMQQLMYDKELATIAVLHDVVEDSSITLEQLHGMGFSNRVIFALTLLTHDIDITYEQYIDNMCCNYDAIRVKRKDLQHNSDITRLKGIRQKDLDRVEKYHRAFVKLGEAKRNFKKEKTL